MLRHVNIICLFFLLLILFLCIRARWYQEGFEVMFQRIKSGMIDNDIIDSQYMRDDTKKQSAVYFYVNDQIPTETPTPCPTVATSGSGMDISQLTNILNNLMSSSTSGGTGSGTTYDPSTVAGMLQQMGINLGGGGGPIGGNTMAGVNGSMPAANAPAAAAAAGAPASVGSASVLSKTSLQYQYSFEPDSIVGNNLTNVATNNPDAVIYNMTISTTNPAVGSGAGLFDNAGAIIGSTIDRNARFLMCPDLNTTNYTNGLSISLWMFPNTPPSPDTYYMALSLGNTYTDNIYIGFKNQGLYYGINGKDGYGTNNVPSGIWTHVVWTISNTGTHMLYINGVDAGVPDTDSISYFPNYDYPLAIGYNYMGLTKNMPDYFCGYLDEIRIYNRVLSVDEVSTLYNKGDVT
jgi:Concanavalin A-like lectin/glucanases superfamily